MIKITRLDHFVLTVVNIEETVEFYRSVLGMQKEEFAGGRVALIFGQQKINLHQQGKEFKPNAAVACLGSADICLLIETDLKSAMQHVKNQGVEILEGPVERTGAGGPLLSFYFRDPDGNLVELSNSIQ